MGETSDEQLMRMFQDGNGHAFQLLFERYRGPVFGFLYRMLDRQREDAEDLLQEIFVKVHSAREFYEPRAKFSTWLFAISRNHCLNFIRSKRYRQAARSVSLDEQTEEMGPEMLDQLSDRKQDDRATGRMEKREVLEQALSCLDEGHKEVFLLRAVQGFTHEEIAQILGMEPGAVRTRFHRARMLLREQIGDVLIREGEKI